MIALVSFKYPFGCLLIVLQNGWKLNELPRIRMVWNSIPMQLAKENKKFFFGKIKEGARSKDFEIAIEWLLDCGLINKIAGKLVWAICPIFFTYGLVYTN